jgi:uridine kinase
VTAPLADYPGNRFVTQRYDFGDRSVLIVEGTYVLRLDEIGIGIFLEATHEETRERRRIRNRDLDEPIIDQILAIEHRIIALQAERAQIVVGRDFAIRQPS